MGYFVNAGSGRSSGTSEGRISGQRRRNAGNLCMGSGQGLQETNSSQTSEASETSGCATLRLLCDKCIPYSVIKCLQNAGFEVPWAREVFPKPTPDEMILQFAHVNRYLLITCDVQDFGELIFRGGQKAFGVILLRGVQNEPEKMAERLMQVLRERGERLEGYFTIVTPRQVRQRKLPKHC